MTESLPSMMEICRSSASADAMWCNTLRLEASRLSLLHRPPCSLAEWNKTRRNLHAAMIKAAGLQRSFCDLAVTTHGEICRQGYLIQKLSFQSRENLRVTANLFIPAGSGPFPAILSVHGHWMRGKAAANVLERCIAMVLNGFVVLSVDAAGTGERGSRWNVFETHGDQKGAALLSAGESLLGLQVQDNMRGIDLLQSLSFVDRDRIGVTGASGGGNQTMWLAALDNRIKAAIPVTSVGSFEAYVTGRNCWCETLPKGLLLGEEWSLLGLIAPRPLLILSATDEDNPAFRQDVARRTSDVVEEIYRLHQTPDRFSFRVVPGPHGYFPDMQRHMLGWFRKWLLGRGDGSPFFLPDREPMDEEEALCFVKEPRPEPFPSLLSYVSEATRRAKERCYSQPPGSAALRRRRLRRLLCLPPQTQSASRAPIQIRIKSVDRQIHEEFSIPTESAAGIPCQLVRTQDIPLRDLYLAVHAEGAKACLENEAVRRVLENGHAVCAADLRDLGTNSWDHPDENLRHAARASLWVGRTVVGNWTHDILTVATALRKRFRGVRLRLLAFSEPTVSALAAAALDKRFAEAILYDVPASFVVDGTPPTHSFGLFVPGILHWGDVTLLAALAQCPLSVQSLVHPAGEQLTLGESASWREEVRSLQSRFRVEKLNLQTLDIP